ncbi:MAG: hypothetical protein GY730_11620 [bacterium]|nr:hypothetical protein [bacterium]
MISIDLFSYLKNTDLNCLSAFDAITMLLKYDKLKKLKKFRLWELKFSGCSKNEAVLRVKNIIDKSYYILNPNKESYYLSLLPCSGRMSVETKFLIKVKSPGLLDDSKYMRKIRQKVGVEIDAVQSSLVWEMTVEDKGLSNQELKQDLINNVIVTSSRKNGLLVNPVSEQFEFLDTDRYYRTELNKENEKLSAGKRNYC